MENFKLERLKDKEVILNYLIVTDFGKFGITEITYGEESSMIIIKKDNEFAIGNCKLYCCRGHYDYGTPKIDGTLSCYYTEDEEHKALEECQKIMKFVCDLHNQETEDDEIYDIFYGDLK